MPVLLLFSDHLGTAIHSVKFFLCLIDGHVIQIMNENLNSGLSEELILRIFTDVCEAVATLHHSQPPVMHRDLKVSILMCFSTHFWHCSSCNEKYTLLAKANKQNERHLFVICTSVC